MYFAMITEKKKNEIEIELQEGVDQIRFSWQHLDVFANLFVSGEVCDLSGFEPKKKKTSTEYPKMSMKKRRRWRGGAVLVWKSVDVFRVSCRP